jgi:hypothetical protein
VGILERVGMSLVPGERVKSVIAFYPPMADETMAPAATPFSPSAEDFLKPLPVTVVVVK